MYAHGYLERNARNAFTGVNGAWITDVGEHSIRRIAGVCRHLMHVVSRSKRYHVCGQMLRVTYKDGQRHAVAVIATKLGLYVYDPNGCSDPKSRSHAITSATLDIQRLRNRLKPYRVMEGHPNDVTMLQTFAELSLDVNGFDESTHGLCLLMAWVGLRWAFTMPPSNYEDLWQRPHRPTETEVIDMVREFCSSPP